MTAPTIDIAALRQAAEAATPGPWSAHDNSHFWEIHTDAPEWGGGYQSIGDVCASEHMYRGGVDVADHGEANARFIAAANPSAVLALCERVEAAERERDEAEHRAAHNAVAVASAHDEAEAATALAKALEAEIARLREALAGSTRAENSNARRMREAIVEARRHLAKGRALWNGPCHQCDAVLEQALRADNDAEAIARAALSGAPAPAERRLEDDAMNAGPDPFAGTNYAAPPATGDQP